MIILSWLRRLHGKKEGEAWAAGGVQVPSLQMAAAAAVGLACAQGRRKGWAGPLRPAKINALLNSFQTLYKYLSPLLTNWILLNLGLLTT